MLEDILYRYIIPYIGWGGVITFSAALVLGILSMVFLKWRSRPKQVNGTAGGPADIEEAYLENINRKIKRCWRIPYALLIAIVALAVALYVNMRIEGEQERIASISGIGFGVRHYSDGSSKSYVYGSRQHKEMEEQELNPLYYLRDSAFILSGLGFSACVGWTIYYVGLTRKRKAFLSAKSAIQSPSGTENEVRGGVSEATMKRGSIVLGSIWMIVISTLLFWLPIIGPVLAGIVGGKRAGSVGRGIVAFFLPAIVAGILTYLLAANFAVPILSGLLAASTVILILTHSGPMLVGAIIGGILA